jgi:hypothetical protein
MCSEVAPVKVNHRCIPLAIGYQWEVNVAESLSPEKFKEYAVGSPFWAQPIVSDRKAIHQ